MSLVQRSMPQVGSTNPNTQYRSSRSASDRYRDVGRDNGSRTNASRSPSVPRSVPGASIASLPQRSRALSNVSGSSAPPARNLPSRYPESDRRRPDDGNTRSTTRQTENRANRMTPAPSQAPSRRPQGRDQGFETVEPSVAAGVDQYDRDTPSHYHSVGKHITFAFSTLFWSHSKPL